MAAAFSEGLGTPVTYTRISDTEAYNMFLSVGFEPWQATGFIELFNQLALGAGEFVSQDSKSLLGRPPTTLAIWARDHFLTFMDYARTASMKKPQNITLPLGTTTQLTNGQGQQTVNQQGQQGAVQTWQKSTIDAQSSLISGQPSTEVTQQQLPPVSFYQRTPFPHLTGHTER